MLLTDKFLKIAEVSDGDLIKIVDEGKWVESTRFQNPDGSIKRQCAFTIELADNSTRTLNMNAMSRDNLKFKWGRDTALWVGKLAKITIEEAIIAGRKQKMLILMPED